MDTRIPIGTAAVVLLLLPLGYQLYTSTAMTQPPVTTTAVQTTAVQPQPAPEPVVAQPAQQSTPAPLAETRALPKPQPMVENLPVAPSQADAKQSADEAVAPPPQAEAPMMAPLAREEAPDAALSNQVTMDAAPAQEMTAPPLPPESFMAPAPSPVMVPTTPTGDQFAHYDESPLKVTAQEPVSTFSIDVDTASYSYVRSSLESGITPEPDSVRIEEMVNYFPYDYPAAASASEPFRPTVSVYPTPWNPKTELLQIGIKGYVPPAAEHKPANLVFLIDTSGSMDEPDKLPLLKRAFSLLVDQLSATDTVSIVTYAGSAGVVLEPTKADQKAKILAALDNLEAGGSTAGAEGIALAYQLAEQHKVADGTNRVILATDGDFNVGIDDPDELKTFIAGKRDSGVFLSVLGFGEGNLDDETMQSLAQNGNGNASYIDSFKEAQKVLVAEGGGTLETIAKDVKIQVEFNPAAVSEYRLVGYESRALSREDFNNDKVDAGDVGAGTSVTALYEITPAGSGGELVDPLRYGSEQPASVTQDANELAFLKLRYKLPDSDTSKLIETPIGKDIAVDDIAKASDDSRFAAAVAAFGQKLKDSKYGDAMSWGQIKTLAQGAKGADAEGYRAEFVQLVDLAASMNP
ncbi:MAG TPA: von Willebrand factor type A domain-containing protein [Devosiaceae bacterium]